MTNTITVRERALCEIANALGIAHATEELTTKRLREDLGADSLEVVELCMNLEDEFAIEIPDEDMEPMKTVADVLTYMERRVAATAL